VVGYRHGRLAKAALLSPVTCANGVRRALHASCGFCEYVQSISVAGCCLQLDGTDAVCLVWQMFDEAAVFDHKLEGALADRI
jgi:hypothetical protein